MYMRAVKAKVIDSLHIIVTVSRRNLGLFGEVDLDLVKLIPKSSPKSTALSLFVQNDRFCTKQSEFLMDLLTTFQIEIISIKSVLDIFLFDLI